jgi:hypothetical protein
LSAKQTTNEENTYREYPLSWGFSRANAGIISVSSCVGVGLFCTQGGYSRAVKVGTLM